MSHREQANEIVTRAVRETLRANPRSAAFALVDAPSNLILQAMRGAFTVVAVTLLDDGMHESFVTDLITRTLAMMIDDSHAICADCAVHPDGATPNDVAHATATAPQMNVDNLLRQIFGDAR